MKRTDVTRLRSFSQKIEYKASRSLDLLKAIDDTIDACDALREIVTPVPGEVQQFLATLEEADRAVDRDGLILAKLEHARDFLGEAYRERLGRRASAAADPELNEDDGVVEAYDHLLSALEEAHNSLNELCWALGEHDADYDEVLDGEFSSAEDLITAMHG